jgi:uncharacterized protein involved in copper resistance
LVAAEAMGNDDNHDHDDADHNDVDHDDADHDDVDHADPDDHQVDLTTHAQQQLLVLYKTGPLLDPLCSPHDK